MRIYEVTLLKMGFRASEVEEALRQGEQSGGGGGLAAAIEYLLAQDAASQAPAKPARVGARPQTPAVPARAPKLPLRARRRTRKETRALKSTAALQPRRRTRKDTRALRSTAARVKDSSVRLRSWPLQWPLPPYGAMSVDKKITRHKVNLAIMPPLGWMVRPYAVGSRNVSRCTSGLVTQPRTINLFGSLRCCPATHRTHPALTCRGCQDAVNQIKFSPLYRKALRQAGGNINEQRTLSPAFGEWLYGLPQGWTSVSPMPQAQVESSDNG